MKQKILIEEYKQKGFVVVKKFLSKKELVACEKSLNSFAFTFKRKSKRDINFTSSGEINSIHNLDKWLWISKIRSKFSKNLIDKIVENKSKNFGSEYFAKPAKTGLASPVHQDNYYWCLNNDKGITVWVALDKVDKKNGGVFYYEGSHKIGLLKHKASFAPGSSQTVKNLGKLKNLKITTPKLNPGDCIIHNAMIVHGSNKNTSKFSRRGITIRYVPKSSKVIKKLKQNYETSLIKQNKKYI